MEGMGKYLSTIINRPIFVLGETNVTTGMLVLAAAIVFASWLVSKLVRRAIARALRDKQEQNRALIPTLQRLSHYGVMAFGIGLALDNVGVNLGTLFAAGAVVAVGLGFAMQNIAQNFVSGIILLVERAIKPGDIVEVEKRMVRVQHMGIRSAVAITPDEDELIVPNSLLVQSAVRNFTLNQSRHRIRVRVGVSYSSDLDHVLDVLEQAALEVPNTAAGKAPVILLLEFGSSSIDFEASIWIRDPWEHPRFRSLLSMSIWRAFKRESITIAFPQLDIHLNELQTESGVAQLC